MKKKYLRPCAVEHSFEFCDGIALIGDITQSGDQQLGKERYDEEEDLFDNGAEWQNGLW